MLQFPQFDIALLTDEGREEVRLLPLLTLNSSDGLQALHIAFLSRNFAAYLRDQAKSTPTRLLLSVPFADSWQDWLMQKHRDKADKLSAIEATADILLYARRRIWLHKIEKREIESPHCFVIAYGLHQARAMRGYVHEAVGHGLKHQQLPAEIRDEIDGIVKNHIGDLFTPLCQLLESGVSRVMAEDRARLEDLSHV